MFQPKQVNQVSFEKGMIEKAYPNANPDTNAEEILAYLKG